MNCLSLNVMIRTFKSLIIGVCIVLMLVLTNAALKGQDFVKTNPFETNFFIENHGQFQNINCTNNDSIYFALENGQDAFYFLSDGFVIKFSHLDVSTEKLEWIAALKRKFAKGTEWEEERFEKARISYTCIRVKWLNVNMVEPLGRKSALHYFTYGDPQFNSKGYEEIVYPQLYNGADLIFDIPAQGGVHYQFNCCKGFDWHKINWQYNSGAKVYKQRSNSLLIVSGKDSLLENGLRVTQNFTLIPSKYLVNTNRTLSFDIAFNLDSTKPFIIDPFVTQITTLRSGGPGGSKALDVDYDYVGNAFVFGGGSANYMSPQNQKIAKYAPNGLHKWTFMGSVPSVNWESKGSNGSPGNFIVDKVTGKAYCGQGFENSIGTRIVRIDSNGVYNNYVSTANTNFRELWDMAIDCRNKSVFGMGGSTYSNQNCGSLDTLGNFTAVNFTGISAAVFPNGFSQDVTSCVLDDNRNLFALVASGPTLAVDNHLYRLNSLYNGNVWSTSTGWNSLSESDNKPYVAAYSSNGFNAIDVNDSYVFYYDGQNLAAYDKSSGAFVSAGVSMPGYSLKRQGGIASDHCNRVYIGGNNGAVNVLSFNGSNFLSLPDITLAGVLGRKVYDVKLNRSSRQLFICGDSFVAVKQIPYSCNIGGVQLQTNMQCPNLGICNILNYDSTSSYLYIWRDSTTHITLKFLKNTHKSSDTIIGVLPNHLYAVTVISNIACGGPSKTIAFSGSTFYASQNFTVCAGQGIAFGSHYYTTSGTFIDTIYQGSCATVWITKLTVRPKYNLTRTYAICSGNAVHIGNHFYYSTGNYHDTLVSRYGCDSIIHSNVIVGNSSSFTQNLTGCSGSPIVVGSKTYYLNGTFVDTLYNYIFCDSVVTTHLSFYPSSSFTQHLTTCFNHPISVGPYQHASPGIYVDHLTNRFGCDSTVTTYLAVVPYKAFGQTFTICQGSSITVGSHTYTNLGYYYDTLVSYSGCDSIVTTGLSWNPTQYTNQILTTCSNHPLQVGMHIHNTSGFYIDTITASTGCDSIIFSLLTVLTSQSVQHNFHFCAPTTITVGTHSYISTGLYRDTFVNKFGCDSIIITNLVIGVPKLVNQLKYLCSGPIPVGAHVYTLPGIYHDTLQSYLQCDSIVNTTIMGGSNSYFTNNISVCTGAGITIGNHYYFQTGTYYDTLINQYTCDSFVVTNLTVKNRTYKTQTLSVCYNHPLVVGVHSYNTSGVFYDTLVNYKGCDSIVTTNLTVLPISVKNQNIPICFGQSYHIGNHYYSLAGIYKDTLKNYVFCDSIVTTMINIKPRNVINKNIHFCFGNTYAVGFHTYTQTGIYHDTLINKFGCDSIINSNLVFHTTVNISQSPSICQGQSLNVGTNSYTSSGFYLDTLLSSYGCDSIVHTTLQVLSNSNHSQSLEICGGQSVQVGSFTHSNSGTFIDHLTNYLGCDSAVTTILNVKPRSFKTVSYSICAGDFITVGAHLYSAAGTYHDTFVNYLNCDSILTTILTVNPIKNTYLVQSICKGFSVNVGPNNYTNPGVYLDTFSTSLLCDSIVHLNLSVNDSTAFYQNIVLCQGDSVLVNGHYYKNTGLFLDTTSNYHGCDSFIYTNLKVAQRFSIQQQVSVCQGDSIIVGIHSYSQSGIYIDTLYSVLACDSVVKTTLNVLKAGVELSAVPDTLFFVGDQIDLIANPQNANDSVLLWNPSSLLNNTGSFTNTIIPSNTFWVGVETVNKAGCKASDSIQLIKIDIEVPNAFTPNGDNQNDLFLIRGSGIDAVQSLEIFNRWGERVYSSNDPLVGWDGKYQGVLQQMDTYTYQIKVKNKNSKKIRTVQGNVMLIL